MAKKTQERQGRFWYGRTGRRARRRSRQAHRGTKLELEPLESRQLLDAGMRVEANLSDDRVGYKIRESSLKKIPFAIIVGEKEVEAGTINVRDRDSGDQKETNVADFIASVDLNPPKKSASPQAAE